MSEKLQKKKNQNQRICNSSKKPKNPAEAAAAAAAAAPAASRQQHHAHHTHARLGRGLAGVVCRYPRGVSGLLLGPMVGVLRGGGGGEHVRVRQLQLVPTVVHHERPARLHADHLRC